MTDIERQVSDFFHEEAKKASPSPGMYERVLRRSRTRRAVTSLASGAAALAIVAVAVVAVGTSRHATTNGVTSPPNSAPAAHLSAGEIARIPVGNDPQPIAADNQGAWVVAGVGETSNVLWHIDARTQRAVEVPRARGAIWPAVGEGFAWVTCNGAANPCGGNSVLKLDPTTGATVATVKLNATPFMIATGLGSVWVSTPEELVKIDPVTATISETFPIHTNYLGTAGGWLWATGVGAGVVKLDPSDGRVLDRISFGDPCDLLTTDQGVWASTCSARDHIPDTLIRVDPASGKILYRVDLKNSGPMVFSNGRLWITHWAGGHFEIEARDPATGKPTGTALTLRYGPHPWGAIGLLGPPRVLVALGADSIWLTHVDAADVVRVGLGPH